MLVACNTDVILQVTTGRVMTPAQFVTYYDCESGSCARTAEYRQVYVPRRATNAVDGEDDREWFDDPATALACPGALFVAIYRITTRTELWDNPPFAWYDVQACRLFENDHDHASEWCEAMDLASVWVSDEAPDIAARIASCRLLFLETMPPEFDDTHEETGVSRQVVENMRAVFIRLQTEALSGGSGSVCPCMVALHNVWSKLVAYCGLLGRHVFVSTDAATTQAALLREIYDMGSHLFPHAVASAYEQGVCSTRLAVQDFLEDPVQVPLLDFHLPFILDAASPYEVNSARTTFGRPYYRALPTYSFACKTVEDKTKESTAEKRQRV